MTPETTQNITKAARSAYRKMPNHLRRSFELADLVSIGTLAVLENSSDSDAYIIAYHAILDAWKHDERRGTSKCIDLAEYDAPNGSRNHHLADIELALRSVPSDIADTARRVLAGETAREIGRSAYMRMERAFERAFA